MRSHHSYCPVQVLRVASGKQSIATVMTSVGILCQQQFSAEKGANSETGARWIRASRLRDRVDELVPEEGNAPLSWKTCCPFYRAEYLRERPCRKIACS